MASLNDLPVLMLSHHRNADISGYTLELTPMLGFPGSDEVQDGAHVNQVLEAAIRKASEQYMWVHKRFKGKQKLYKEANC